MPNKMLTPDDYERRDLSAQRIDFKPQENRPRPSSEPTRQPITYHSSHPERFENILLNSANFRTRRPNKSVPVARTVESASHSAEILKQAVKGEYRYGILGLVLGLATIIGGTILALHGVVGHTSWTAKLIGFESQVNDAAPGVVLFIIGVFLVYITKPRIKLGDLRG